MEEKEKMVETYSTIISDMLELLNHTPEEGLRWGSTRRDLMESIHMLYEEEVVTDEYNVPIPYRTLVQRVCDILGEVIPHNPHSYIDQHTQCRGIRRQKLLLRYESSYIIKNEDYI